MPRRVPASHPRRRLDVDLVARGLAVDLAAAQALIDAHRVRVAGVIALKSARQVSSAEPISVTEGPPRFVSRAGFKLDGAIERFAVTVAGRVALDVGSSTGGFTDCLLERGAQTVVAVDVGTNQMHERVSSNPRVILREQTDIRRVTREDLPSACDLVTVDVSFVSVTPIAAHLSDLAGPAGELLVLVKPQFEATRHEADRGRGVIEDPAVHRRVLGEVAGAFERAGTGMMGAMVSPLRGASGNVEFFFHLRNGIVSSTTEVDATLDQAVAEVA